LENLSFSFEKGRIAYRKMMPLKTADNKRPKVKGIIEMLSHFF
jgi:hypothetical protein